MSAAIIESCAKRAVEISEEQAQEKAEKARLEKEAAAMGDDAAAAAILGDAPAAAILGDAPVAETALESDAEAQSAADSILGGGPKEPERSDVVEDQPADNAEPTAG